MRKKILFYIIYFVSVVFLALIGVGLAVFIDYYHSIHPECFSGKGYIYIISVVVSIWMSIVFHEIVHVIGYTICKCKIRFIYVFPFCIVHDKRKIHFSIAFNPILGIGGIVLPYLPFDFKNNDITKAKCVKSISLFSAPLCSLLYGVLSLILFFNLDCFATSMKPYFFAVLFSNILVSVYIAISSLICFGGIVGDFVAGIMMLNNKAFAVNQIYNDFLFQEDNIKRYIRKKHIFLHEIFSDITAFDKNVITSSECCLIDIAIFEWIISKEKRSSDIIDNYIAQIIKDDFSSISGKIRFENYGRLFCHIIIYLYIYSDKYIAKSYWEKHKNEISSSPSFRYYYNQCEMLFYPTQNNEKIVISSLDSILNKIPNYYNDENDFNDILIGLLN